MRFLTDHNCKNENNITEIYIGKNTYEIPWEKIEQIGRLERRDIGFVNPRVYEGICTLVLGSYNKKTSLLVVYDLEKEKTIYSEMKQGLVAAICVNDMIAAITDNIFGFSDISKINFCVKGLRCKTWKQKVMPWINDSGSLDTDFYTLEVRNGLLCCGVPYKRHYAPINNRIDMFAGIEYGNYDDWIGRCDFNNGEFCKDSIFIKAERKASALRENLRMVYFMQSPKYAAGFVKYIYLGIAASDNLISERNRKKIGKLYDMESTGVPDVETVLTMCSKRNRNKAKIATKFKKAIAMCERVFICQERELQIKALKDAALYINSFLDSPEMQRDFGCSYKIEICDGVEKR